MTMRTPPTPEEAQRGQQFRQVNLGQRGMSVAGRGGGGVDLASALQGYNQNDAASRDIQQRSQRYGLAEALADPIQVTSGTWGEAAAEALAGGIRGRIAMGERRHELEQEQQQRQAFTNATRAAIDPNAPDDQRGNRIAEALLETNPEAALQYHQEQQPTPEMRQQQQERQRIEAIISQLPPDQQALARLNPEGFVSGMMRHQFPAPQRSAPTFDPSSDEWEPF